MRIIVMFLVAGISAAALGDELTERYQALYPVLSRVISETGGLPAFLEEGLRREENFLPGMENFEVKKMVLDPEKIGALYQKEMSIWRRDYSDYMSSYAVPSDPNIPYTVFLPENLRKTGVPEYEKFRTSLTHVAKNRLKDMTAAQVQNLKAKISDPKQQLALEALVASAAKSLPRLPKSEKKATH